MLFMKALQETLIYIVSHRLFASSPTAFGKLFSENDRNRGIRIMKGITKNFDSTLQHFEEQFGMSSIELHRLMVADRLATDLYNCLPMECEGEELKELGNKLLLALMKEDYRILPDDFSDNINVVSEMRYQQREQYLCFLALFFIKYGMYRIYNARFKKDYYSIWKDLGTCFREGLPNRCDLHSIVESYTATNVYCEVCHPSVWGIVQQLVIVLDIAENPEKREERLRTFHLFDWDTDSYWRIPDSSFVIGQSEIWWLYVVDTKVPNNGFYTVMHVKNGINKESYDLVEIYNLMFIKIDDFEGYSYLVHLSKTNKLESVVLGVANYDEDTQTLHFEFDKEIEFPTSLQMIDLNSPTKKENKVWKNIIEHFISTSHKSILKQARNHYGNFEFLDDEYEVVDVRVGRKDISVFIKNLLQPDEPEKKYSIELSNYPCLECIHPSDDACIIRKHEDNELYITWWDKDLQIKLKEFRAEEL